MDTTQAQDWDLRPPVRKPSPRRVLQTVRTPLSPTVRKARVAQGLPETQLVLADILPTPPIPPKPAPTQSTQTKQPPTPTKQPPTKPIAQAKPVQTKQTATLTTQTKQPFLLPTPTSDYRGAGRNPTKVSVATAEAIAKSLAVFNRAKPPEEILPWEMMPEEPLIWYNRFVEFMHLGPDRTLSEWVRMSLNLSYNPVQVIRYAQKFCWKERAAAWDKEQARQKERLYQEKKEMARAIRERVLEQFSEKVIQAIDAVAVDDITWGALVQAVKVASQESREEYGDKHLTPAQQMQLEVSGPDGGPMQLNVKQLEGSRDRLEAKLAAMATAALAAQAIEQGLERQAYTPPSLDSPDQALPSPHSNSNSTPLEAPPPSDSGVSAPVKNDMGIVERPRRQGSQEPKRLVDGEPPGRRSPRPWPFGEVDVEEAEVTPVDPHLNRDFRGNS